MPGLRREHLGRRELVNTILQVSLAPDWPADYNSSIPMHRPAFPSIAYSLLRTVPQGLSNTLVLVVIGSIVGAVWLLIPGHQTGLDLIPAKRPWIDRSTLQLLSFLLVVALMTVSVVTASRRHWLAAAASSTLLLAGVMGASYLVNDYILKPVFSVERPPAAPETENILEGLGSRTVGKLSDGAPSGFMFRQSILLAMATIVLTFLSGRKLLFARVGFFILWILSGWLAYVTITSHLHQARDVMLGVATAAIVISLYYNFISVSLQRVHTEIKSISFLLVVVVAPFLLGIARPFRATVLIFSLLALVVLPDFLPVRLGRVAKQKNDRPRTSVSPKEHEPVPQP